MVRGPNVVQIHARHEQKNKLKIQSTSPQCFLLITGISCSYSCCKYYNPTHRPFKLIYKLHLIWQRHVHIKMFTKAFGLTFTCKPVALVGFPGTLGDGTAGSLVAGMYILGPWSVLNNTICTFTDYARQINFLNGPIQPSDVLPPGRSSSLDFRVPGGAIHERATDSKSLSISGAQCVKLCFQKLYRGFWMPKITFS